jgi:2,4-dienoyl-CoA reductase-like NADH-dependent reductase (Old Yellow Enzyme family)
MQRNDYTLFSAGKIGDLTLPNRLVRSATWDPSIIHSRRMSDEVLALYREQALGGVGLIITGGFPVLEQEMLGSETCSYDAVAIEGLGRLADVVHSAGSGCLVVAQLEVSYLGAGPSAIPSPFMEEMIRPLSTDEIVKTIDCFVQAIVRMQEHGFDGVQLHAAHGGLLSCFLSPYTNRRDDAYGGSVENRVRIVGEIISGARETAGNFPILIKMNATDYLEGGIDLETFPELAKEIERVGVDAIEVSGGMWDCLARPEEALGFRPVPAPESHTRIHSPEKQSYFLRYAERLDLDVPVILVGGNRDVERLEEIVRRGAADYIALCRPLLSEPDLPNRWREGRGASTTDCISCNSCIHDMYVHPGRPEPGLVACIYKRDKEQHRMAQEWLASWVEKNVLK